jgi:hypothetical protein
VVGIVFDSLGTSAMELAAAAQDLADVVWITGWLEEADPVSPRLLGRLGTVVEHRGIEVDGTVDRLRELGVSGLIAFTDEGLPLAGQLAGELGVIHNPIGVTSTLCDKLAQRQAAAEAGLRCPRFATVDRADPYPALAAVGCPAVLKPRRGSGSMWTWRIGGEDDLAAALASAPDAEFTVEEFIEGSGAGGPWSDVLSVESVVVEGDIRHLAATGRLPFAPPFRETGSFMPSQLRGSQLAEVLDLAAGSLKAFGVQFGVMHTEVKLSSGGPVLIEVNGRPGGGIHRLMTLLGGPPLLADALRVALGMPPVGRTDWRPDRIAFLKWKVPPLTARRIVAVHGLKDVQALAGVEGVAATRTSGPVDPMGEGFLARVATVEGTTGSYAELAEVDQAIERTITVDFEQSP